MGRERKKTSQRCFKEEMGHDVLAELIQVNILALDLLCKDSFREPRNRPVNSSN